VPRVLKVRHVLKVLVLTVLKLLVTQRTFSPLSTIPASSAA